MIPSLGLGGLGRGRTPAGGGGGGGGSDPYFSSVVLGLHLNGTNASTTFTDITGKTVTAVGNAQISTAQSKFGGASAFFDGSGDGLLLPTSSSLTLDADFTIEFFGRFAGFSATQGFIVHESPNHQFRINSDNKLWVYAGGPQATSSVASSMSTNTWYHIAASRSGSTLRFFIDGTKLGTDLTFSSTLDFSNVSNSRIAKGYGGPGEDFSGYMDDFRITKGVARYTANFTAPTAAFPDS